MAKNNNLKKTIALTLALLMMASNILILQSVAQTERTFTPYLSFRPTPVGVGQPVLVNFWTSPSYNVQLHDYTVTITDPNGKKEVMKMDPVKTDATAWFEFVPDEIGNYTLKFSHPEETIDNYIYP